MTPWDEIAIQYVLVCTYVAKRKPGDAFQEHSALVSSVLTPSNGALTDLRGSAAFSSSSLLRTEVGRYLHFFPY